MLGEMNPVSSNYTVFFLISQSRDRQEHHQLKIEDLKVSRGIDGKIDVIEWMEGPITNQALNKKPRVQVAGNAL